MATEKKEEYQPGIKYPIVKAAFDLQASKRNYQELLQNLSSVTVTKDNVNDELTKDGREVLKALETEKEEQTKEPRQWHKDILAAHKSLANPLEEQIQRILAEKKVVAAAIQKEIDAQIAEQTRINNAKSAIVTFTNKVATMIAGAKTDDEVVSIEKMIGLEKTKKNVYQEFLPDLITQCDGLRPQIKEQKENIRNLKKLNEQEQIAIESGDIIAQTNLKGEKELLEAVIQETGIRIHETAFEQSTTIEIVAPEVIDVAPKGRTNWKWEVDDIKLLQKKMPHLIKIVPNDEAIDLLLKTKKQDGSLAGKDEEMYYGIRFFNDKYHTK